MLPNSDPRRARGRPRDWNDKTEQNTIKSLDRAMELLERLSRLHGATLSELASDLDQSHATVYRVLVTLEQRGIVEFDVATQLWQIGAGAFLIGARYLRRTSLVERARPFLRALTEATGETANLGIEKDGQVMFLSQVETHSSIRAFFPPGTLSPMHASGIGKALLSFMPEDRRRKIVKERGLEQFTPQTIASPEALEHDVTNILGRGYSLDDEERTLGMKCVAAPIFNHYGEAVAGLSVSGPSIRMTETKLCEFGLQVKDAAARLSHALGADAASVNNVDA